MATGLEMEGPVLISALHKSETHLLTHLFTAPGPIWG